MEDLLAQCALAIQLVGENYGAVPNGPWQRDLAALVDGAVSLDRLNPDHIYYIEMDLRPESGGEGEQYLFGGTPSEIEGQLIAPIQDMKRAHLKSPS